MAGIWEAADGYVVIGSGPGGAIDMDVDKWQIICQDWQTRPYIKSTWTATEADLAGYKHNELLVGMYEKNPELLFNVSIPSLKQAMCNEIRIKYGAEQASGATAVVSNPRFNSYLTTCKNLDLDTDYNQLINMVGVGFPAMRLQLEIIRSYADAMQYIETDEEALEWMDQVRIAIKRSGLRGPDKDALLNALSISNGSRILWKYTD